MTTEDALLRHLVEARLTGAVATPVQSCLTNAAKLAAGEPDYTFGLSDWRQVTYEDVLAAVVSQGCDVVGAQGVDPVPDDFLDPKVTLAGIARHRAGLADIASRGGRVLVATGHPSALLGHYSALARALAAAGCTIVTPLEGERDRLRLPNGEPCMVRYVDGVGSLCYAGGLHHTHRPEYMEAMLDELGPAPVELVLADHGFAGAAVERGIATLSIADVNDPALPLAQSRGRTDGVLLIDDGLEPAVFVPVTEAMLAW